MANQNKRAIAVKKFCAKMSTESLLHFVEKGILGRDLIASFIEICDENDAISSDRNELLNLREWYSDRDVRKNELISLLSFPERASKEDLQAIIEDAKAHLIGTFK